MTDDSSPVLLVLNAGSSGIKFSLYHTAVDAEGEPHCLGSGTFNVQHDTEHLIFRHSGVPRQQEEQWPRNDAASSSVTLFNLMDWIERHCHGTIRAAVHRVVHGGTCTEVVRRIDPQLMAQMQARVPMAPLHQARCLAPISYLAGEHPGLLQFACFDTAFHSTLDPLETDYGLPRALTERGLRRYGFHGLSYAYIASVLPRYDPRAAAGRTIVAHLGSGASLCALDNGVSRATSMGFSTLDGVLMGTRPGHLDPGILLYLLRECGMTPQALEHLLYHQCGLLGVSGGLSSDMRELQASAAPEARHAIALFVRSVVREIGTLAAVLGGIDALVFTAGIGEHAPEVRSAILDGCRWLGLRPQTQQTHDASGCLSQPGSEVTAWVIPTDENLIMARHALHQLSNFS
ncbi:propionate kinase [Pseudomonas chlororaphis]|uniref:acetate/propionate family kinase n=1 Tax=Pseudomonas chlororaphis TaxID=587753 RepID=UPI00209A8D15|nr:propionate kinase [Pseudomonas chlororaphis]MCO7613968.1 propionate kinase [Pseudomonas chlororaphis]